MTVSDRSYWEERLGRLQGLDGVGYLGLGRSFNTWMYRVRRATFRRRARKLVAERGRAVDVLDIGSGTGFYVAEWRKLGVRSVTGSDITETATSRLSRAFPDIEFVRFDVSGADNPFGERRFDVVSAFDVLFHIVDDDAYARALGAIHRLLRPGGVLILSDNFLHGETRRSPTQVSRSLAETEEALRAAGFEPGERRPALVLMNAPIDSPSRTLARLWAVIARAAGAAEPVGWTVGAAMYPLDLALTRLLREGPTTETMICRRP